MATAPGTANLGYSISTHSTRIMFKNVTGEQVTVAFSGIPTGVSVPPAKSYICMCNSTVQHLLRSPGIGIMTATPGTTLVQIPPYNETTQRFFILRANAPDPALPWQDPPRDGLSVAKVPKVHAAVIWTDFASDGSIYHTTPTCCCRSSLYETLA